MPTVKVTMMSLKYKTSMTRGGVRTTLDYDSTRERKAIWTIERVAAPTKSQEKKRAHARRKRAAK